MKKKAIILAAGLGTRMKSDLPKVVHQVCGKPLVVHVIEEVQKAGIQDVCVVVGHGAELVKAVIPNEVTYVEQKEQLGTGHAVMQALDFIQGEGSVLILPGDGPMVTAESILKLMDSHEAQGNKVTVWSAEFENPFGYGRIIRDEKGSFSKIVEQKDTTPEEAAVKEVNSGIYCFDTPSLQMALGKIDNKNAQGEYYLPDTLKIIKDNHGKVETFLVDDVTEIMGINSRIQLAEAEEVMRKRINEYHMVQGVTIIAPQNTYIHKDVVIGRDTIIYPGTILEGTTVIGEKCIIGPGTRISQSTIGNEVEIQNSVILESKVCDHTSVGPFAYLRPGSDIGSHVKIGDFVEVKNSVVGDGTKVSHLTYIGDADVGKNINFGCGTVIVNYDGEKKHRTVIEDNAFIGCNTNLVSPVTIREGAYTAAGSTITEEVPSGALGIARAKQQNKEGWVAKKKGTKK